MTTVRPSVVNEANRVEVRERRTGVASPQRLARRILLVNRNVRNIVASTP